MLVGIDTTPILYGRGVSRYTANLTRHLSHIDGIQSIKALTTTLRQFTRIPTFKSDKINEKKYPIPPSLMSSLVNKLNLPIELLIGKVDVYHAWDWYVPRTRHAGLVVTVHDLTLFKFPEVAHPDIKAKHQTALKRAKKFGAQFIAVSDSTKQDLIDIFNVPQDRVTVVYEALPQEAKLTATPGDIKQTVNELNIKIPYLLCVGTPEPRKNYPTIINAWQQLEENYSLVIVGGGGWQELPKHPKLIATGHLEPDKLAALYSGAKALVYTSLYEGFGLPILEAFYHQIPVVTSDRSSMPEVAGEAAVLVDPEVPEAIIAGITKAVKQSEQLVYKGAKRLKQFSWEKTAQQTYQVYQKAL